MGDARGYDAWGQRIAGGEWIGTDVFYQAPLYPYFLGIFYTLLGRDLTTIRIVQAIIGSLACVFLGLAAQRLFSRRVGLVAGLTLAVYAPAIFFDSLLQKSVLDVFFMCLVLWLLSGIAISQRPQVIRSERQGQKWLGLGMAMAGLTLTRENALLLVVIVLGWALIQRAPAANARRERRSRTGPLLSFRPAAAFVLGLSIVLLPVALRNYAVTGGFYLTTSQFGPNFYIGNNPDSDGTYASLRFGRGAPEYERQDATELAEQALGRPLTPSEVSSYWTDRALGFITTEPGAWLRLIGRKFILLWSASEMLDTESQETYAEFSTPVSVGSWFGHFGVLAPLALLGVWATWPVRRRLLIFYALTISYAASVVIFYVFARYRFPLVPLLMVFTSPGLVYVYDSLRHLVRRSTDRVAHEIDHTVRDTPDSARALLPISLAVVAVTVFTNWPVLSPTLMQAITENNLGTALQEEGRLDDAIERYQRAIALSPGYAPAYNNMGAALRARGDVDEAIDTYQQAIAVQPNYPDAHYNLANALLDADQPDLAAEHFQLALVGIPGSAQVHNNLGIALAEKGQFEEAVTQFRLSIEADPNSAIGYKNLGNALAAQGRSSDALPHLQRAAELAPADGTVHYDLGSVLFEGGALEQAEEELRTAVTLIPDWAEAHNNLGIVLGSQGKLEEATVQFQRALAIQPDYLEARQNLETVRGTAVP